MEGRILVCGRAVWDDWQDVEAIDNKIFFGGPGANIAVHLSALGHEVSLLTSFGTDEFSLQYQERLRAKGIDISHSIVRYGELPRVKLWLSQPGVYEYAGDDGFSNLKLIPIERPLKLFETIVLADFPICRTATARFEQVLFCSPHYTLISGVNGLPDLLSSRCHSVFMNEAEASAIGGPMAIKSYALATRSNWFVTHGSHATAIYARDQMTMLAVPGVQTVSTIGGGDAFAAAAISAQIRGFTPVVAAAFGHAAASVILSEIGCQSAELSLSRLERLMASQVATTAW